MTKSNCPKTKSGVGGIQACKNYREGQEQGQWPEDGWGRKGGECPGTRGVEDKEDKLRNKKQKARGM